MPTGADTRPRHVYTVSDLNRQVRQLLEASLPLIWIEGEISNLATPASGHIYFSLKDEKAQLRCAMFRNRKLRLRFRPQNGQKVLVRGRVGLYEARGEYQLVVEHMEEAGAGLLQQRFEELKARLDREGLFAPERKKPLPALPHRIGIITSPTGAAIRDVLSVLERRFPLTPVFIYPTSVQGDQAPGEIVRALQKANREQRCDVLLVVRGGGSLEDLWAFNEEIVARAIADSAIPVIAGVGHETDFTIADFVADQRAPTPSVAAEMAVPRRADYLEQINRLVERLGQVQSGRLERANERLGWLRRHLNQQHPRRRLQQNAQRLDELEQRLIRSTRAGLEHRERHLEQIRSRLAMHSPARRIRESRSRVEVLEQSLARSARAALDGRRQQVAAASQALEALSPLSTLGRGYSISREAESGQILRSVEDVEIGDQLRTRLPDGEVLSTVESIRRDSGEG